VVLHISCGEDMRYLRENYFCGKTPKPAGKREGVSRFTEIVLVLEPE
jgi:hypothetical protein